MQQERLNFDRIAEAITYLTQNFKEQPSLADVANKLHLSPFHFQRIFSEWAGVSPKKFLQFLSVEYAKNLLQQTNTSVFDAAFRTGLSGTSRLHDLFVNIEGMTPGEYKNGGAGLAIDYAFSESPFGNLLVASTTKGVCYLAFDGDEQVAFQKLQQQFPNAIFHQRNNPLHQDALSIFFSDWSKPTQIKLHLKGTPFQLKVWQALLQIPAGGLSTYKSIAQSIGNATALRAVGTAIGANPVAFIIPCHRVIQTSGAFGNYHWGASRKAAIIGWEAAKVSLAI